MEPPRSPYAVPLTELEGVRVAAEEQVVLVRDPRLAAGDAGAPATCVPAGEGLDGD